MLYRPSSAVEHCQRRAAECDELAALARTPDKDCYLRLAQSWRGLAENTEFIENLDRFLGYGKGGGRV